MESDKSSVLPVARLPISQSRPTVPHLARFCALRTVLHGLDHNVFFPLVSYLVVDPRSLRFQCKFQILNGPQVSGLSQSPISYSAPVSMI